MKAKEACEEESNETIKKESKLDEGIVPDIFFNQLCC